MEQEKEKVVEIQKDPVKIEVSRGLRGTYGWSITIRGKNLKNVTKRIREADAALNKEYGEKNVETV